MVLTRSASNMHDEDSNDEFDTTVREQGATMPQQQPLALEMQVNEMAKQLQELRHAIANLCALNNTTATTSNIQATTSSTAPSLVSGAEASGVSIVETLADLNRTLAITRSNANKKLYDLPEFDGRPEDWPMFRESFYMTTEEYGYNERQNMLRLQKAIKGKAREVVECLLIHSSNAPRVIEALQERFGRPELLVKSQIARIRNFSPISENRLELLVPFATKVQNLAMFLESAGCEYHLSNPTLMEELLLKLPIQRRLEWARYAVSVIPRATISHFSNWLKELARVVNAAGIVSNTQSRSTEVRAEARGRFFHTDEVVNGNHTSCKLCTEAHHISRCKRFLDMNNTSRWGVVREEKLCFNCMNSGHRSNRCTYKHKCSARNCTRKVHGLLHADGAPHVGATQQSEGQCSRQPIFTSTLRESGKSKVLFKILPVILYANGKEIACYAFLDEGSSISLMNKSLADRLGLKGKEEKLMLQWLGNNTVTKTVFGADVQISCLLPGSKRFEMKNIKVVDDLQLPRQTLDISELQCKYRYTEHLPISDYSSATPQLLIGLDNAHLGVAKRTAADGRRGPAVVLTKLGWLVYGSGSAQENSGFECHHTFYTQLETEESLELLVKKHIADEALGVNLAGRHVDSVDVARAKDLLEQTTVRKGNRFETGLLWRNDHTLLPDSRKMAEKRLLTLEKKFDRDPDFRKQYIYIMAEYERKGYARRLSDDEVLQRGNRTWYLPHFGVCNANKPEKLRLVFDAAAQVEGVCLNSALLNGPDLCQPLNTILMKFRQKAIGVCGDIVEMFHQIQIRREDQNAQRFLWRSNTNEAIGEYLMSVMTFGATCSPCSAQFVKNRNAEDFRDAFPNAANAILNNHYVDDYVHCFNTPEEAVQTTNQVRWIHKQGGFELKRFASNVNEVSERLNSDKTKTNDFRLDKDSFQKVLGMYWDTAKDNLRFALSLGKVDKAVVRGDRRPTKREALSIAMSVFDPFGLASEFTIAAKLVLQAVWRKGVGWDESIPDDAYQMWLKWLNMLKQIENLTMPRCYDKLFLQSPVELHIFADASEAAYAVVGYWRVNGEAGAIRLAFVMGKAKCAPLKLSTVPRLELQSAVLAVRLRVMILQNHDMVPTRVVMWSDSKTTLAWIKSDHRRYKPYVAHRVNEILENSEVSEWRWLPSARNPADFGTRPRDEKRTSFWASGPDFLLKDEKHWPATESRIHTREEIRAKFVLHTQTVHNFLQKFSCFTRLSRVVAWMLRFRDNCQRDLQGKRCGQLTVTELERAELVICRAAQKEAYAEEHEDLSLGKHVKRNSTILTLSPYMDDSGVIRVKGRIDNADAVPLSTRRPIILPKAHHVTDLIVAHHHRKWKHQNEGTIVAEIRRKFWIPHVRVAVRRAAKECQTCKINRAKPETPIMGPLPQDRLTPFVRPFSYVGLDYMGPFHVTIGRRKEKRWIALFTCLTTRAVHMEIARDLSTDSCLLCIRSFMSRRGTPVRIRSDNATNFIGADRELRKQVAELGSGKIADALANERVEWVFNCPLNPHAGGCWERLVRSVKRAMGHALHDENLQEHCLYGLMCEAENMVNSRPLTHIPLDTPTDEPITPNHFLLGTANSDQTPHPREEEHCASRKQWRKVQQAQHRFWKKWLSEYLPDLCRRTKWHQPVQPLRVGDVVLIVDSNMHRSRWPMGRVIQVFPGKDLQVRSAEVRTSKGVFRRPACLLAKLDVGESV